MLARLHEDLAEYWALAGPLYSADPVLHTVEACWPKRRFDCPRYAGRGR